MARFAWTYRQFVGGNAALDLANTVVYPTEPAKRHDRLVDAVELGCWIDFGVGLGTLPAGLAGGRLSAADRHAAADLRDAVDAALRPVSDGRAMSGDAFGALLAQSARALAGLPIATQDGHLHGERGRVSRGRRFLAHVALEALSLAFSPEIGRIKTCPACAWLFIDRSRNRKRIWCDMEVCGNRAKSQRHYAAQRAARIAARTPSRRKEA